MWHVFAPIVRWPLRSPLRLGLIVVAFIAFVMVTGQLNASDKATPDSAPTTPTTAASAPTSTTPTPAGSVPASATTAPVDTEGGSDADSVADDGPETAAEDAAASFVAAWARPDLKAPAWLAGVTPHATPEFAAKLKTTNPANTPNVTVAGEPVEVAINAEAAVFDVPTSDSKFYRVQVQVQPNGAWLATDIQPTLTAG